jgi:hypothetical protein
MDEEMNFFLQKSDLGQLPKKKDNWLQVGLCQKGRQSWKRQYPIQGKISSKMLCSKGEDIL